VTPTPCDGVEIAREAVAAARAWAPAGVQIRLAEPNGLTAVLADPGRLRQILSGLLTNAVKHGGNGLVELRIETAPEALRFAVRDEGPGIPPGAERRIFEPYYRLPGARAGGTGLGLYLAKELAEAMGGRIAVSSEPGQGSTFTLELPLRARAPRP
jgi:signal transduction histidine kinase